MAHSDSADQAPLPDRLLVECTEKPEIDGVYERSGARDGYPQWTHVDGERVLDREASGFVRIAQREKVEVRSEHQVDDETLPDEVKLWEVPREDTWGSIHVKITKLAAPEDRALPPARSPEQGRKRALAEIVAHMAHNGWLGPAKIRKVAANVGADLTLVHEIYAPKLVHEAQTLVLDPVFVVDTGRTESRRAVEERLGRELQVVVVHGSRCLMAPTKVVHELETQLQLNNGVATNSASSKQGEIKAGTAIIEVNGEGDGDWKNGLYTVNASDTAMAGDLFYENQGLAEKAGKKARKLIDIMLDMLREEGLAPDAGRDLLVASIELCKVAKEKRAEVLEEWQRRFPGERRKDLVLARVDAGDFLSLSDDFERLEVQIELPTLAEEAPESVKSLLLAACERKNAPCYRRCMAALQDRDPSLAAFGRDLEKLPKDLIEELAAKAVTQAAQGDESKQALAVRLLELLAQSSAEPADQERCWHRVLALARAPHHDAAKQRALTGLLGAAKQRADFGTDAAQELASLLVESGRIKDVAGLVPRLSDEYIEEAPELRQLVCHCEPASASRLYDAEAKRQAKASRDGDLVDLDAADAVVLSLLEAERLTPQPRRRTLIRERTLDAGPQRTLDALEVLLVGELGAAAATSDLGLVLQVLRTQQHLQTIQMTALLDRLRDMGRELKELREHLGSAKADAVTDP